MKLKLTGVTADFCLEFMVRQNLIKEFREKGFIFTKVYPHAFIEDKTNLLSEECDITLENNDTVMIVDVIPVPSVEDIGNHVQRLKKIRTYAYINGDNRTFLGSIAVMSIKDSERDFALNSGIFVIEHDEREQGGYDTEEYTEETFTVTVPERNCLPAETVSRVNDLYLENEQVARILSDDVKNSPVKIAFPSPWQKKRTNRYACQS
jgi:hypothetical protein